MLLTRPLLLLALAGSLPGEEDPAASTPHIAWYTTWQEGLAEARRTNRPILLHSAAPQCSGVPGMW